MQSLAFGDPCLEENAVFSKAAGGGGGLLPDVKGVVISSVAYDLCSCMCYLEQQSHH
jgi:hypothetical protein